jgi:oligopeptide/dipeptide ABC transporter ATP-binding protein
VIEQGEVLLDGVDVLKMDTDEMLSVRGAELSMIFQEPMTSLNPVLTIGRQLTESLEVHLDMDRAGAVARAGELLEMVGIPDGSSRLDEPKKSKLVPIEGMPPDLSDLPQGCAFRARCRFAIEKCATEYPPSELIDGTDDHHKSCWINVDESAEKDVYVNR